MQISSFYTFLPGPLVSFPGSGHGGPLFSALTWQSPPLAPERSNLLPSRQTPPPSLGPASNLQLLLQPERTLQLPTVALPRAESARTATSLQAHAKTWVHPEAHRPPDSTPGVRPPGPSSRLLAPPRATPPRDPTSRASPPLATPLPGPAPHRCSSSPPRPPARRWTPALHLEGLEEAAAPAAVLHLVLVAAQAHHGLAVDVQLLIERLQEGGPCPLLWARPSGETQGSALLPALGIPAAFSEWEAGLGPGRLYRFPSGPCAAPAAPGGLTKAPLRSCFPTPHLHCAMCQPTSERLLGIPWEPLRPLPGFWPCSPVNPSSPSGSLP